MTIVFYSNASDNNVLSKSITEITTKSVEFRNENDITNFSLVISDFTDSNNCNYAYIESLGRYYYVNKITLPNKMIKLTFNVDVLMSFKSQILVSKGVINRTNNSNLSNVFVNDNSLVLNSKTSFKTISFPNGFSSDVNYLVTVYGGTVWA